MTKKGVPASLMRGNCRYCGRRLVYANIPNRGPVMAHQRGDREACDRLRYWGRDLVTRNNKTTQKETN